MAEAEYLSGISQASTLPVSYTLPIWFSVTLLFLFIIYAFTVAPKEELPIPSYELVGMTSKDTPGTARERYEASSKDILAQGITEKFPGAFQVYSTVGPMIVLPKTYTDEIKSHPHLSFSKNIVKSTFAELPGLKLIPGMNGFIFGSVHIDIFADVVRKDLMQSLGRITAGLAKETSLGLKKYFPPTKEWSQKTFYPTAVDLVSRLSARVFLGEEICRNDEWIYVSGNYAVEGIEFIRTLRNWPAWLRPVAQFFLPIRLRLMQQELTARKIIRDELNKRRIEKDQGIEKKYTDALQWLQDAKAKSGRNFDIVSAQLGMTLGAIHTTSMALARTLFDLCDHPEWVQPLREEVVRVLKEDGGWQKTTLHKMKLMDSVMKESQRLSPVHLTIMTRIATENVTLSGGIRVRKGDMLTVTTPETMMDPEVYPEPEKFIGDRFLKMREVPGNENKWQFVTTSPDHIGFGHGQHACPGRFFAGNELKIALAYMLMLYDWKFADGHDSRNIIRAQDIIPNPAAQLCFKQREPEIQL